MDELVGNQKLKTKQTKYLRHRDKINSGPVLEPKYRLLFRKNKTIQPLVSSSVNPDCFEMTLVLAPNPGPNLFFANLILISYIPSLTHISNLLFSSIIANFVTYLSKSMLSQIFPRIFYFVHHFHTFSIYPQVFDYSNCLFEI